MREREFGILDLLTRRGVAARFPSESERRDRIGKFYYRPPGGESWVDVALRLRSLRESVVREFPDRRVMLVTHEVPIIIFRYLVEALDEQAALDLSAEGSIANCSLTSYRRDDERRLVLEQFGWTVPIEESEAEVTDEPDAPVAPGDRAGTARPLDAAALAARPLPVEHERRRKRVRGTVLVAGGTDRTAGALALAGLAALRTGPGRLQLAVDGPAVATLAVAVPEASVVLVQPGASTAGPTDLEVMVASADAVLAGSGALDPGRTAELVAVVVDALADDAVVVLDALALCRLPSLAEPLRQRIAGRLVLTPNHEELAEMAPGLGTSGSGDVLAGIAAGAATRGGDAVTAACWAAFVHQEAGRAAAARYGPIGYLARELLDEIPAVLALKNLYA